MSHYVEQMSVVIELDSMLNREKQLSKIADGFAEILRHDISVSKFMCSESTKNVLF